MSQPIREQVYDSEIAPLMTRIIELCKEHKIPLLAQFILATPDESEDGEEMVCTTALLDRTWGTTQELVDAYAVAMGKKAATPKLMAFTITGGGGDG